MGAGVIRAEVQEAIYHRLRERQIEAIVLPFVEAALAEHGSHDQRTHGRGGEAKALTARLKTSGGFTYEPSDNRHPTTGWVVAPSKATEKVYDLEEFDKDDMLGFLREHSDTLLGSKSSHVGGWVDSGKVYLDVSEVTPSQERATTIGVKGSQIGIFNLGTSEYHELTEKEYEEHGGAEWRKLWSQR